MKHVEMVIGVITLLTIIAFVSLIFFVGWGRLGFGPGQPFEPSPLLPDSTLYEKTEWETYHGNVCLCAPAYDLQGPVRVLPVSGAEIAKIAFTMSGSPAGHPDDVKDVRFMVSTNDEEKSVRPGDPAVTLLWIASEGEMVDNRGLSQNAGSFRDGPVHVELDLMKMGFTSPALGPEERFSLVLVPPGEGFPYAITRATPDLFIPGTRMDVSRDQ